MVEHIKNIVFFFLLFFGFENFVVAQVPQKIVVEHFTNTRCSICAGQNPGFYANLANHPEVLHLAIHPSSPYPACVLSQQNVAENDARTNYYGVYGSTPKLLINGVLLSSTNYGSSSIFTPYESLMSPVTIRIEQTKYGNDSIRSKVIVKTVSSTTLANLSLFVALAEDTIFYSSPNGETLHHDVFRKSLTGATGISFSIAPAVGDSVTYVKSSSSNVNWDFTRINTIAILQDALTKSVVQSEYTSQRPLLITGINTYKEMASFIRVYVSDNAQQIIFVNQSTGRNDLDFVLQDLTGRILLQKKLSDNSEKIKASELAKGIYLFSVKSNDQILKTGKLIID